MEKKPEEDSGILLPILYALLVSVGVFTIILTTGIVYSYKNPAAQAIASDPLPATAQPRATSDAPPQGDGRTEELPAEVAAGEETGTGPEAPASSVPASSQDGPGSDAQTVGPAGLPGDPQDAKQDMPEQLQATNEPKAPAHEAPVSGQAVPEKPQNGGKSNPIEGPSSVTSTRDFSNGRVLATTESNNNNDPVYHTKDCSAAKKIAKESEYWYNSAEEAEAAGRRLCGNCGR